MLKYQPSEGTIISCDFGGFSAPEMIKTRPVVVLRRHRTNSGLVTIVPLSTTVPAVVENFHVAISSLSNPCWAKCDMVYTVSIERLDRFKTKDRSGNRVYKTFQVTNAELVAIRAGVADALGIQHGAVGALAPAALPVDNAIPPGATAESVAVQ